MIYLIGFLFLCLLALLLASFYLPIRWERKQSQIISDYYRDMANIFKSKG